MMISRRNFLAVAGGQSSCCRCSDRLRWFFLFHQHRFFHCFFCSF